MIRLAGLFEIDAIWPHIAAGINECCERVRSDMTPDWLLTQCRRGDAFLFVIEEAETGILGKRVLAALIGRSLGYGGDKVLFVNALWGRGMDTWIAELLASPWPRDLGFSKVVFEGRKGWEGALPNVRVIRQVYELDLEHGQQNTNL